MNTALPQIDKLAQSLLLIRGIEADAHELASKILGENHTAKIKSHTHPDVHEYYPEEKSGLHNMASMQRLIREMALPPFEAREKIFILYQVEKMLPSSSNALLKTLEEPNLDTYFILLSDQPDRLLPTILSRLHPITYATKEIESFDLSSYLSLVQEQRWDELLDRLVELDEIDPQMIFNAFLSHEKDPVRFYALSQKVTEGQKALDHNVKPRTVYLQLLLENSF